MASKKVEKTVKGSILIIYSAKCKQFQIDLICLKESENEKEQQKAVEESKLQVNKDQQHQKVRTLI